MPGLEFFELKQIRARAPNVILSLCMYKYCCVSENKRFVRRTSSVCIWYILAYRLESLPDKTTWRLPPLCRDSTNGRLPNGALGPTKIIFDMLCRCSRTPVCQFGHPSHGRSAFRRVAEKQIEFYVFFFLGQQRLQKICWAPYFLICLRWYAYNNDLLLSSFNASERIASNICICAEQFPNMNTNVFRTASTIHRAKLNTNLLAMVATDIFAQSTSWKDSNR